MHPALQIFASFVIVATILVIVMGSYLGVQVLLAEITFRKKSQLRYELARINAALDRTQTERQKETAALAEQLDADRDEASRALTRAALLSAQGITPPR